MSETIKVVSGDGLSFVVALTLDGDPFPWGDWSPVSQLRRSANGAAILAEFDIDWEAEDLAAGSARFTLDDTTQSGVWDVQFTDPETGKPVTWPGAGLPRHRLVVTPDVTRPEEEGS